MADASQWAGWIADWRASGLSSEQFCKGKPFTPGGLRHMAHRLGKVRPRPPSKPKPEVRMARVVRAPAPSLVAATPAVATEALVVVDLGGARVAVRPGFDRATLAAVLDVLSERGGAR